MPDPPRKRGGPRWTLPLALAISAALHLLALLVFRFEPVTEAGPPPNDPLVLDRPIGMRVYDIVPVNEAPALPQEEERTEPTPPPPELQTQPPPAQPAPAQPAQPRAETPPPPARAPSSVAERISPRMSDPRLFDRPALPDEPPVHRDEIVRRRIATSIDAWNDSVRLAEQAAAKAVDWTVKDGEGGRWGVSPEGIHLGSFTLPIPVRFSTPLGRREGAAAAQQNWSDIQLQRGRAAAQEDIKDRIKAIRARKEAERRDTTRGGGGS